MSFLGVDPLPNHISLFSDAMLHVDFVLLHVQLLGLCFVADDDKEGHLYLISRESCEQQQRTTPDQRKPLFLKEEVSQS